MRPGTGCPGAGVSGSHRHYTTLGGGTSCSLGAGRKEEARMNDRPPKVRLTQWASCAGCAAKMDALLLADALKQLPRQHDPNMLVGPDTADDAGVYRIAENLALVNTVDFFPPVVD